MTISGELKGDSIFDSENSVLMKRTYLMKVLSPASRSTRRSTNTKVL
jgi:hypothetical protein